MSARKVADLGSFNEVTVQARQTQLLLSPETVLIRKNGIEFRSPKPFPTWTEMTLTLQTPAEDEALVNCTGVVVGCNGNRHSGYAISMVFTGLTPQAEAQLATLPYSALA